MEYTEWTDTSPEVCDRMMERLRQLSGVERLRIALELSDLAYAVYVQGCKNDGRPVTLHQEIRDRIRRASESTNPFPLADIVE